MLPVLSYLPASKEKKETILLLHEKGKSHAVQSDSLQKQLVGAGHAVILADLPGIGELGPGYLRGDAHIRKSYAIRSGPNMSLASFTTGLPF